MMYSKIVSEKREKLQSMLAERREELRVHSFSFGQAENSRPRNAIKKEIAQINTALNAQ